MAVSPDSSPAYTYGNWRRPASSGIGGLGTVGTGLLMLGMVMTVLATIFANVFVGVAVAALFAGGLALLVFRDAHHRSVLQRIGVRVGWWQARRAGAHLYRSGPLGRTPWGTCQLPGLAAPMELSEWQDSYARPFALIRTPSTRHFTVVFSCEPDGAALVDHDQIETWVARWGHWLSSLGHEPGLVACSVTVETAPDTGVRLRREVGGRIDPDAPALARAMLEEVVQTYPVGSASVTVRVALTFTATNAAGKRLDTEAMARNLASRLPGLVESLRATGAGAAHPMPAQELCEAIRVAYDPAAATLVDDAYAADEVPPLSWVDAGPAAHDTGWDHYRHDSALSISYMMSQAPRGEVYSSVLTDLLAPHPAIARKRVTLLYRPVSAATAARIVEADKRSAMFRATTTDRPSARSITDLRAAEQTAQEEARGAGLVNFGMVVTTTVTGEHELADAHAALDNLSASARILLRPVYGSQDSAFAAALPIGLVLPIHLRVPAEFRTQL